MNLFNYMASQIVTISPTDRTFFMSPNDEFVFSGENSGGVVSKKARPAKGVIKNMPYNSKLVIN